ncbi:MAG: hypothetical protein B7Z72_07130, partial [Gemmatimonadetes bacterium 21-71-4]
MRRASLRACRRRRYGANQRAAPGGSSRSGTPRASCGQTMARSPAAARQGGSDSPRSTGRSSEASISPV